ncbi:MAG: phosphate signaling complex protein PhoU [Victivallaceae bacterium]|nr:phosphate signaling complex protein PhoU [Victivallaceae bacterium]
MIMKTHFMNAMENLKIMLADLAAQAEGAAAKAVKAAECGDCDLAAGVIVNDAEIDASEIRIEEECLKLLALYQPVAGDLRSVVTILKVNGEIERVGDLAVNIAERASDMALYRDKIVENFDFHDMVIKSCEMLKLALDAFTYGNAELAAGVIKMDDALDELHRSGYGRVKRMILAHPDAAQYYLDCLTVSRCLERIGDAATNICEDVIYLESGRIVRHCHGSVGENGK